MADNTPNTSSGIKRRKSVAERAQDFEGLVGRVNNDAIRELIKSNPEQGYAAAQQQEKDFAQAQQANNEYIAELDQQIENTTDPAKLDELNSEKALALAAGQKFSHQIKNSQELQIDAENAARARATQTFTPKLGG